jgi:LysR family glycine cleavage system transcriptional activator
MRRSLPPLNSLRAFEAAARHLSLTQAAQELSVTPAAISHQIRLLEDHIGMAVMQRSGRGLVLTDAGAAAFVHLKDGFQRLSAAMDAIDSLGERGTLHISVAPSFAAKWLLPRLDDFEKRHPEIDVHVSSSMQLVDFARDGTDLAIRYGAGNYPEVVVERLLSEEVVPVCAPELIAGDRRLTRASDLGQFTLLHDDSPDNDPSCPNWDMWLRAAGVEGIDGTRGPRFNQSSLVIEAAVLGRGVALAKHRLAAEDIKRGRLVTPFADAVPLDFAYFIVSPKAKLNLPKVSFFRDWLRVQVRDSDLNASDPSI